MNNQMKRWLRILGGIFGCAILLGGSFWYYRYATPQLYEFSFNRDMPTISHFFDQDWYWLIPFGDRSSYSPEEVFRYRAPHQNPLYSGRLAIKVMRQKGSVLGFVAYYMKNPTLGFLNFVYVDPHYRGKRYAEQLVRYAMNDMIKRGAQKITLVTRPSNKSSRSLYKRLGFKEVGQDDTFVYIEQEF